MTDLLVGTDQGPAPEEKRRRRRLPRPRYAVVALIFLGAIVFLLTKMGGALNYYDTVDQALSQRATLGTEMFRLEGVVVPGSVHRTADGVDFVAEGSKDCITVINTGNPPQLFQPGIPVVVDGHFSGQTFVSHQIIVDHSANYVEAPSKPARALKGAKR